MNTEDEHRGRPSRLGTVPGTRDQQTRRRNQHQPSRQRKHQAEPRQAGKAKTGRPRLAGPGRKASPGRTQGQGKPQPGRDRVP
jgi:hypothetical protein